MAVPPPSPLPPDKAALRLALRTRRRAFVAALGPAREARLEQLAERVLPHLAGRSCIAGYVAHGSEIDPAGLLARLADDGVTIALPHVGIAAEPMRFLRWAPGEPLDTGAFGLSQPPAEAAEVEPDCILTPLLGFDRARGRIGQGAGFYDRAFARHPDALRIGLAWSVQEVESVPMDPWDMPLDAIATEIAWIA